MNKPHTDHQPGFELPQPVMEDSTLTEKIQSDSEVQTEKSSAQSIETGASTPISMPGGAMPMINPAYQPLPVATNPSQANNQISSTSTPPIADDIDLIEKEWVDKAKDMVERTKNDPYVQNKEMTKIKADYLKKRYNKDIKLSED